ATGSSVTSILGSDQVGDACRSPSSREHVPGNLDAGLPLQQCPAPQHGQRIDPGGEYVGVLCDLAVRHLPYAFDDHRCRNFGHRCRRTQCWSSREVVSTFPPGFIGNRSTSCTLIAGENLVTTDSIRDKTIGPVGGLASARTKANVCRSFWTTRQSNTS